MDFYYLNLDTTKNPNGDNEVHKESCRFCPVDNRVYLGLFSDGREAVNEAKRRGFQRADGCFWCCKEAHRR